MISGVLSKFHSYSKKQDSIMKTKSLRATNRGLQPPGTLWAGCRTMLILVAEGKIIKIIVLVLCSNNLDTRNILYILHLIYRYLLKIRNCFFLLFLSFSFPMHTALCKHKGLNLNHRNQSLLWPVKLKHLPLYIWEFISFHL